jgi:hypothetical protein
VPQGNDYQCDRCRRADDKQPWNTFHSDILLGTIKARSTRAVLCIPLQKNLPGHSAQPYRADICASYPKQSRQFRFATCCIQRNMDAVLSLSGALPKHNNAEQAASGVCTPILLGNDGPCGRGLMGIAAGRASQGRPNFPTRKFLPSFRGGRLTEGP